MSGISKYVSSGILFYQLRQRLGHQLSTVHNFTMNINQINLWLHLLLKQVIEAGFTGLNTRAGDLLTVKFKYGTPVAVGAVNAQRVANYMNIVFPLLGSYLGNP